MGRLDELSAARFVHRPRVLSRDTTTGAVVLVPGTTEPLVLNQPASLVWRLVAIPRTAAEIGTALAAAGHADRERVEADVRAVLDELVARGAVTDDGPDPA